MYKIQVILLQRRLEILNFYQNNLKYLVFPDYL